MYDYLQILIVIYIHTYTHLHRIILFAVLKPEVIAPIIKTKPEKATPLSSDNTISPTKLKTVNVKSKIQGNSKQDDHKTTDRSSLAATSTHVPLVSPATIPEIVASPNEIVKASLAIDNDLAAPEYDLLSRQPPQFIEETYRVVNLKSTTSKNTRTPVVVTPEKNSATSISLSSKLPSRSHKNKKNKVRPSSTLQVLKTAAPITPQKHSSGSKIMQRNSSTSSSSTARKVSKKGSSHRGTPSTSSQTPEDVIIVKSTTTRNKPKRY